MKAFVARPAAATTREGVNVRELVDGFVAALMNARVYFGGHPRVTISLEQLQAAVVALSQATRRPRITLHLGWGYVVFQNRPVINASLAAGRLLETFERLQLGGLEIEAKTEVEAYRGLVDVLNTCDPAQAGPMAVGRALQQRGVKGIRVLPPVPEGTWSTAAEPGSDVDPIGQGEKTLGHDPVTSQPVLVPTRRYQEAVRLLQDLTVTVCQGGRIEFGAVYTEAEQLVQQINTSAGPLTGLANSQEYDAFTLGHSMRVTVLAMSFAKAIGFSSPEMLRLGAAALMHDIGKAMVPFEILHARRALTDEERRVVSRHPELGAEILLGHDDSDELTVAAAFGHHRQFAGMGYPATWHDHVQSVATRIVKICDVYEALTAARPYKPPMSAVRAYRIMLAMTGHFDPQMLTRFIRHNGVHPTGNYVRLNTGETAFVLEQTAELELPRVVLSAAADGTELSPGDRVVVDLRQDPERRTVTYASASGEAATKAHAEHDPDSPEHAAEGCCGPIGTTPGT